MKSAVHLPSLLSPPFILFTQIPKEISCLIHQVIQELSLMISSWAFIPSQIAP